MDRTILHSDINACYANIELLYSPHYRGQALVVGGDEEMRRGIVLAKNAEAGALGIKTGMTLWQARALYPELVVVPPHFDRYIGISRAIRKIYSRYTDRCEPFGIDESWLDLTGCVAVKDGEAAAHEISQAIKNEIGLTVSIGVSWNKIYAKLGSDYKKPDAITVINRENYRDIVYPLPVGELLMVGRQTQKQLRVLGIKTIGDLAEADSEMLRLRLGKNGLLIKSYASGEDTSEVLRESEYPLEKSMGNGSTAKRDMENIEDAMALIVSLAEAVGARLRRKNFLAGTICVELKTNDLQSKSHRKTLFMPTDCDMIIRKTAIELIEEMHDWSLPLRAISLRAEELVQGTKTEQVCMFSDVKKLDEQRNLDKTVDRLRGRFGKDAVTRGAVFANADMALPHAQEEYAFLRR